MPNGSIGPGCSKALPLLVGKHEHLLATGRGCGCDCGPATANRSTLCRRCRGRRPGERPGSGACCEGCERPGPSRRDNPARGKLAASAAAKACGVEGQAKKLTGLPGGSSSTSRRQHVVGPPASKLRHNHDLLRVLGKSISSFTGPRKPSPVAVNVVSSESTIVDRGKKVKSEN